MGGLEEVASLAGVSLSTASRALNGRGQIAPSTRKHVEEVARRLGYVASASASSLATGLTRTIGVLMPSMDRWFRSSVLAGVATVLGGRGYDLTLYSVSADGAHRADVFEKSLRRHRVDGVIAISMVISPEESQQLSAAGLAVISVGGSNPQLSTLSVDDVAIARLATEHLISLNHQAIAHIGGRGDIGVDLAVPDERHRGFELALASAGIPVSSGMFEPSEFTVEAGFRAAKQLLGRPGERPTAIFAGCDEIAIGAILAAREMGFRVPDDLSVIGIDGHELGELFSLTTIDQFPRGQGELAARLILDRAAGGSLADTHLEHDYLPYDLVVKGSTKYRVS